MPRPVGSALDRLRRNSWTKYGEVAPGSIVRKSRIAVSSQPPTAGPLVRVQAGSLLECQISIERPDARVEVGARTFIGGGTIISAAVGVDIGDDVLISFDVLIFDHDSHALDWMDRRDDVRLWIQGRKEWDQVAMSPVRVGDNAWIGARSIILRGVQVGTGAVVAAGSIVTSDVPPNTLVAGVPARPIRVVSATPVEGQRGP